MQRAPKLRCEIRVFEHTKDNTSAVCFSLTIPEVSAREGVLQRIGSQTYVTWNHGNGNQLLTSDSKSWTHWLKIINHLHKIETAVDESYEVDQIDIEIS